MGKQLQVMQVSFPWTQKKSIDVKKGKAGSEYCIFDKTWNAEYFLTEVEGEAVWFVCETQFAVFEDSNLKSHYVTKRGEEKRKSKLRSVY